MDYEKNEKKIIVAYESTLAEQGRKICKEVDSTSFVNNELLVEKAFVYCQFISRQEEVDPKLDEKCRKYVDDVYNFKDYRSTFRRVNDDRREKEKVFGYKNKELIKLI